MKKGFTLIEILVAITIIGILAILIIPNIVDSFNEANSNTMKIQENQVLDAAKLYLEDYCRHPISSEYKNTCNSTKILFKTSGNTETSYICMNSIKTAGYLEDDVLYGGTTKCDGFVTLENKSGTASYTNIKTYLKCGNDYETEGINNQVDSSNNKVITMCN